MNDLVNRQEVAKYIRNFAELLTEGNYCAGMMKAHSILLDWPSQLEQKHGKWIEGVCCSNCGWIHETESGYMGCTEGFNYCPRCGADMRENT